MLPKQYFLAISLFAVPIIHGMEYRERIGDTTLKIITATDILSDQEPAEGIVCPSNERLGVDISAIYESPYNKDGTSKGLWNIDEVGSTIIIKTGTADHCIFRLGLNDSREVHPFPLGQAVATRPFQRTALQLGIVIHAIEPLDRIEQRWTGGKYPTIIPHPDKAQLVHDAYINCLRLAIERRIRTLVIPAYKFGIRRYHIRGHETHFWVVDPEQEYMFNELRNFIRQNPNAFDEIRLVSLPNEIYRNNNINNTRRIQPNFPELIQQPQPQYRLRPISKLEWIKGHRLSLLGIIVPTIAAISITMYTIKKYFTRKKEKQLINAKLSEWSSECSD